MGLLEWKAVIAKAKIEHLLELYKARLSRLGLKQPLPYNSREGGKAK